MVHSAAALLVVVWQFGRVSTLVLQGSGPKDPPGILLQTLYDDAEETAATTLNSETAPVGAFAKRLLEKASWWYSRTERVQAGLTQADVENGHFVIGLVRDPFTYYVNMWNASAEPERRHLGIAPSMKASEKASTLGRGAQGVTEGDRERFRRWLRTVNTEQLGVQSLRFFGSFLRHQHVESIPYHWKSLRPNDRVVQQHLSHVDSALANLTGKNSPVHCWVRAEDLIAGMRHCLQQFETSLAATPGANATRVVDWPEFEKFGNASRPEGANRELCTSFFDGASTALVEQADHHLLRIFRYPHGCSDAPTSFTIPRRQLNWSKFNIFRPNASAS